MESLKELNRLVQKPRYREVGNWMVRRVLRDAALPLTWLLLHTPVTANQVTAASLVVGLAGIACFSFSSAGFFLTGTVLLQLWYYLDHVDGQIARYRKSSCLSGRFFDFMTHHFIHGTLFFGLGIYVFGRTGDFFWLIYGFWTSMAVITLNLLHDAKYKTFCEALLAEKEFRVPVLKKTSESCAEAQSSLKRKLFSWLHKLSEMHVTMNLLTLLALFQFFLPPAFDGRFLALFAYGLVVPVVAFGKMIYLIRTRKIDEEFDARFGTRNAV